MKARIKKFSIESIERSLEIQAWLKQFPADKQGTATDLLLKLQFITRDTYAEWLKSILIELESPRCAIYAVRKFDGNVQSLWDVNGETVGRPSTSLGRVFKISF
jgi:hypothetical protein